MSSSTTPDLLYPSADKAAESSHNIHEDELRLRERIKENPTDILPYFQLIQYLETQESYGQVREIYEEFHTTFPFYSPAWTFTIERRIGKR
ncbi:RNA14-like protein [Saccharomyces kudriavzevii IFO 1802]|uniref:RNA14-like protein n=1 Tax=Saccharomyces kudriavzevii (strain ATCC MYA-4449 / AS 2.2408 / CBS 8840 / NBRC 1802 / NCYC 2889) TaxID=226230 RepID=J6EEZ8_SACK1|nr:RNA14-like protein [Saccharomyces kudriavzevii IFO 1802]